MSMAMRVSVVIPTYNRADLLGEAIESVLAQHQPPHEVIIVDDGSTDETQEVTRRYRSLRVLRQDNAGVAAARNAGTSIATGDWIGFLDSDDKWLPTFLRSCLETLDAHPDSDLVYTRAASWSGERILPTRPSGETPGTNPLAKLLKLKTLCTPSSTVIRKTTLLEAGGFNENRILGPSADWELWTRLATRGLRFAYCPEPCVLHRDHPTNMMSDPAKMEAAMLAAVDVIAPQQAGADARRRLMAHVMLRSAVAYYGVGRTREAFHRLADAIRYDLSISLVEPLWVWTLARSSLGSRISSRLRSMKYTALAGFASRYEREHRS
jgi:glycosyltransferase involved in cell wall biosynthesis